MHQVNLNEQYTANMQDEDPLSPNYLNRVEQCPWTASISIHHVQARATRGRGRPCHGNLIAWLVPPRTHSHTRTHANTPKQQRQQQQQQHITVTTTAEDRPSTKDFKTATSRETTSTGLNARIRLQPFPGTQGKINEQQVKTTVGGQRVESGRSSRVCAQLATALSVHSPFPIRTP